MSKTKILFVTECTILNSGYSTYANYLLRELNKNPNYDVAEFATFVHPNDNRIEQIEWKVYPNIPPIPLEDYNEWAKSPMNQFGAALFNDVILDFEPDVVCTHSDWWMQKFINDSPYRSHFKYIWMAPCDAVPQNIEWLDDMVKCDGVLTYTDWAKEEIEKQSSKVKVYAAAPPSAQDHFVPMDKAALKEHLGIDPEAKFIGTVMRNQVRKLFPDLFYSFRKFLDETKRKDIFLYCHTSYPDGSWRIPELIQEYGIADKVLFTYMCRNCKHVFPTFYSDIATCQKCGQIAASMPATAFGISSQALAHIYNLFDVYVQYACCLAKGEQVLLDSGWTNIEDVKIGDMALTHKGRYQKVLNTFKKPINSQMYEIKVCADNNTLRLTEEHPVLAFSKKDFDMPRGKARSFRTWIYERINRLNLQPKFIKASDLVVGDIVCYPREKCKNDITEIDILSGENDISDYILTDSTYREKHQTVIHNRIIDVDNDFCKFIGLFSADGTASTLTKISVTSHIDEVDIQNFTNDIMSRFCNIFKYPYKDRKAVDTVFYDTLFAKLMYKWFGKLEKKQLPDWYDKLSLEKQEDILLGWCLGDGHWCESKKVTIPVTVSKKLGQQVKDIAKKLGISFNCRIAQKKGNRKPQYRFEFHGNVVKNGFSKNNHNQRGFITDDYFCSAIKEITPIDYEGNVYNFEVEEDNSYTTKITAVHNCEGFGISQVEAAACGVPIMSVDYSAMSDVVRKLGGEPIKVKALYKEIATGCMRAVPDNEHFIHLLKTFFNKPSTLRTLFGVKARNLFLKEYKWTESAKRWSELIDKVRGGYTWNQAPIIKPIPQKDLKPEMSSSQYARWLILEVATWPEKVGSFIEMQLVRDLNYGGHTGSLRNIELDDSSMFNQNKIQPFDRSIAYDTFRNIGELRRLMEIKRGKKYGY